MKQGHMTLVLGSIRVLSILSVFYHQHKYYHVPYTTERSGWYEGIEKHTVQAYMTLQLVCNDQG